MSEANAERQNYVHRPPLDGRAEVCATCRHFVRIAGDQTRCGLGNFEVSPTGTCNEWSMSRREAASAEEVSRLEDQAEASAELYGRSR